MHVLKSNDGLISNIRINSYRVDGDLSGLSFAVKDNIDIANETTSNGNPNWGKTHPKPVSNAVCIEQLLSAGACCLGKAQQDELAYSLLGINGFYEKLINSKAPDRLVGGSSSGSACLVAKGLVDFALGTDTGGSTRVPASNCGIWGYRPSHGFISVAGVASLAPSFDTVGVLARSGELLEKVLRVLLSDTAEHHSSSPTICFLDDVFSMCDDTLLSAISPVIEKITTCYQTNNTTLTNATSLDIDVMWLFEKIAPLMSVEIWNTLGNWLKQYSPELSPQVAYNLENYAEKTDRSEILTNLHHAKAFARQLHDYLRNSNKILCFPTTVDLAPKLSDVTADFLTIGDYYPRTMGVAAISGLSHCPEVTIPLVEAGGVPIGLSFVAGYGEDVFLTKIFHSVGAMLPIREAG